MRRSSSDKKDKNHHPSSLSTMNDGSLSPSTFSLSSSTNFLQSVSSSAQSIKKKTISNEPVYTFQEMKQKHIFDSYIIKSIDPALFVKSNLTDMKRKITNKSTPNGCLCGSQEINKWWLETNSMIILAKVFSKHQYFKINDSDKKDEILLKEMIKKLKSISKIKNLTITLTSEERFINFTSILDFLLSNSKKSMNYYNHLRIAFTYDTDILWTGPQYIFNNILDDSHYSLDNSLEIKYMNKYYFDRGISLKNSLLLIETLNKNSAEIRNLLTFQLHICSWYYITDDLLIRLSEFLVNFKKNSELMEFSLYFSGAKISDKGIEILMKSIEKTEFSNLSTLSIGFDTRNDLTSDVSLQNIIQMVLFISQTNIIKKLTICLISKNITNHGLWCIFEGLLKISRRLEELTLVFGNDNKIDKDGLSNLKNLLKSARNLKKLNFGILSSKLDKSGLMRILKGVNSIESIDYFNLYYSNKGIKSKNIENQVLTNLIKWNPRLKGRSIQVFLD